MVLGFDLNLYGFLFVWFLFLNEDTAYIIRELLDCLYVLFYQGWCITCINYYDFKLFKKYSSFLK